MSKASTYQKRAVELFLNNGGDKVDAYVRSRGIPPTGSPAMLKHRAKEFWNSSIMKAMLQEADVQTRVRMERKAIAGLETAIDKYGITKDRILGELAKIAFAQQTDVASWGPDGVIVKPSSEIGDAAAAVSEVSSSGGGEQPVNVKIKLLDKQKALIELGREALGMFQQQVNHKGQVAVAVGAKFIIEGRE